MEKTTATWAVLLALSPLAAHAGDKPEFTVKEVMKALNEGKTDALNQYKQAMNCKAVIASTNPIKYAQL